jgi:hypothetical protein
VVVKRLKIGGHEAKVCAMALRLALPPAVAEYPRQDDLVAIGDTVPREGDGPALGVLFYMPER